MPFRLLVLIVPAAAALVIVGLLLVPRFKQTPQMASLPEPAPIRVSVPITVSPETDLPLEGRGWRVISHRSAHHVRIIKVETDRIQDAETIARELVEPVQDTYAEVLVYFYRPGGNHLLAPVRVQWSPQRGFITLEYEQNEGRPPAESSP